MNLIKKLKTIFYVYACFLLVACNHDRSLSHPVVNHQTVKSKIKTSSYDTLITTPCAVLISPTIKQIDELKAKNGNDFYTMADDNVYYMGTSIDYLDSLKIKTIAKHAKGTIAFKTSNSSLFTMKLDTLYWDIILFNGKKAPIHADMTMIQDDYKNYMKE